MTLSFEAVTAWPQAEELRGLRNECRRHMTRDTSEIGELQQREFAYKELGAGKVHAWLLRVDGAAVAYAILRPRERGALWMSCGVAENARGKGLGTLTVGLVTAMGRHLSPQRPVRLEVWADNTRAVHVYEKAGWVTASFGKRGGRALKVMVAR